MPTTSCHHDLDLIPTLAENYSGKFLLGDRRHGFILTIARTHLDHFCGYVTVPADSLPAKLATLPVLQSLIDFEDYLSPHGGLTYSRPEGPDGAQGYTFGFDCAHYGDSTNPGNPGYRDYSYVHANCILLAEQLHDLPSIVRTRVRQINHLLSPYL